MGIDTRSLLILGGISAIILALVARLILERRRLRATVSHQQEHIGKLSRRTLNFSRDNTELEAQVKRASVDNNSLVSFLVVLPDVVRRLNARLSGRSLSPLLANCLRQLLEPEQILIFMARGDELVLVHEEGLRENADSELTTKFGQGHIGVVASRQTSMTQEEFHSESRFRRATRESGDPEGLRVDVIAPMVHEGQTLGVISVGGITRPLKDRKRMVKLVADLGALALNNNLLLRKWESIANADSLTKLASKGFLEYRLADLIVQAERTQSPLSVLMLDIDHFKRYNDAYGHIIGDEVLRTVASIMKSQVRGDDLCARYGGEEFVVLLPSTIKKDAVAVAEKIRQAVEDYAFELASESDEGCRVTISGGVASHSLDGNSSTDLLKAADEALYVAKEQGRNRIVVCRSRDLSDEELGVKSGNLRAFDGTQAYGVAT